jgi:predicted ATPase with chaperone activity
MAVVIPLDSEALCLRCNPEQFDFKDTSELEDLQEVIGQERALHAIRFGIGIQQPGYNLFALGPNGTGKYTSVFRSLSQQAARDLVPPD